MKTKALKRLMGRAMVRESIDLLRRDSSIAMSGCLSSYVGFEYSNVSGLECLLVRSLRESGREISALHWRGGRVVLIKTSKGYRTYCSGNSNIVSIEQKGRAWRGEFTVQFADSLILKTSPSPVMQFHPRKDFEVIRGDSVLRGSFSISRFKETGCCLGKLSSNRFAAVNLQSEEVLREHFGSRDDYNIVLAFLAWTERNSAGG